MIEIEKTEKGYLIKTDQDLNIQNGAYKILKADGFFVMILDKKNIDEKQKKVLEKLYFSKAEERIKERFDKKLNSEEKEIFEQLKKQGLIKIFKGKNREYYTIKKELYFSMKKENEKTNTKKNAIHELYKKGYLIIEDEIPKELNIMLKSDIETGKILGLRAFDKKFYICTKHFFDLHSGTILDLLETKGKTIEQISKTMEMEKGAVRCLVNLLAEEGSIIERKSNYFEKV